MTEKEKKLHSDAAAWVKRYESLCYSFDDNEARDYADELSEIAEGRKETTERSAHQIKQEMKLLAHLQSLVAAIQALLVIIAFFAPAFLASKLVPDHLKERLPILVWVAAALLAGWICASLVGSRRFWQNYSDVLRRKRMQSFWEWRSATLR